MKFGQNLNKIMLTSKKMENLDEIVSGGVRWTVIKAWLLLLFRAVSDIRYGWIKLKAKAIAII